MGKEVALAAEQTSVQRARVPARRGPKKVTDAHKEAMAAGRREAAVVNRYVRILGERKGRQVRIDTDDLKTRLAEAEARLHSARGVERVVAAQEVRDLRAQLEAAPAADSERAVLEQEFVRIAKRFSERRGITYGAWRDVGVPVEVLERAGISRRR
jgi:hypothetical protein